MTGQEMITCWVLVQLLTQDEANTVTILSPNADFNGQPDYAIIANGSWTNYEDRRFERDTIMECLDAANRERVLYEKAN
jgi:hypothetical protein